MPRAAHGVADHEPLGERAVIVRAMGADGEDLVAALHQQHLLVADMAEKLAVDEIRERDTLGKVRTLRRCSVPAPSLCSCAHSIMPRNCRRSSASSRKHPSIGW